MSVGGWSVRNVVRLLVVALLGLGCAVAIPLGSASADPTCIIQGPPYVDQASGDVVYTCLRYAPGGPSNPGSPLPGPAGPGPSAPVCQLDAGFTYCQSANRECHDGAWHPPYLAPPGAQPPGSTEMIRYCQQPGTLGPPVPTPFWSGGAAGPPPPPPPPPLPVQAAEAIGKLGLPQGTLAFNPSTRTLVDLPTWLWMTGIGGERRGSSAFGLVAIATPDHIQVTPGDGSAGLSCPWVTSAEVASGLCSYAYRTSSIHGSASVDGQPAFAATATPVWTLTFTLAGAPVDIPGVQTSVPGPTARAAIPVAEVQAVTR